MTPDLGQWLLSVFSLREDRLVTHTATPSVTYMPVQSHAGIQQEEGTDARPVSSFHLPSECFLTKAASKCLLDYVPLTSVINNLRTRE